MLRPSIAIVFVLAIKGALAIGPQWIDHPDIASALGQHLAEQATVAAVVFETVDEFCLMACG
jgi:hypothetical protein